jgi:hypothetical protein
MNMQATLRLAGARMDTQVQMQAIVDRLTGQPLETLPSSSGLDEILIARIALRRVLIFLDHNGNLTPADFLAAARLVLQATRTVALLLRDKRALGGEAADSFLQSLAVALDELNTLWGLEGDLKL